MLLKKKCAVNQLFPSFLTADIILINLNSNQSCCISRRQICIAVQSSRQQLGNMFRSPVQQTATVKHKVYDSRSTWEFLVLTLNSTQDFIAMTRDLQNNDFSSICVGKTQCIINESPVNKKFMQLCFSVA